MVIILMTRCAGTSPSRSDVCLDFWTLTYCCIPQSGKERSLSWPECGAQGGNTVRVDGVSGLQNWIPATVEHEPSCPCEYDPLSDELEMVLVAGISSCAGGEVDVDRGWTV